ncbi:MAG: fibronectin type III domain-containing protein [Bacteroidales bacterium]|nr:fibronectin type III domain-containing protein [Bacteroidales bacterium]
MYYKMFTRLFLLIGMIGLFSATTLADEIQIGSGSQTDANLPTHSYYKYSLTQQIYTAAEIEDAGGGAGTINSIAFYNGGSTKTRNFSIYLVNTDKESFSNATDWITVTANDLVYSGEVEMTAGTWKTILFDNPFSYDGSNLAVIVDDNTGNDVSGMSCRIYTASSTQSIYYRNDYTNPDPTNPTISGIPTTNKNQILLDIETATVTCAKPKNFTATSITAHTATLTWQPGAEGQNNWDVYVTTTASDVPDENTTPTYQVTECSKALANLTAQTTYYAYVRANCGGGDKSKWASTNFTTTREALAVDAANPYSQDFESNNDWGFTNGTLTNQWCWGNATNNGGQKAMYVTNDNGTSNAYTLNSTTVIYASKLFSFAQGTYTFIFDWKANGESNSTGTTHYDYMRVALVPGDMEFTAGTSLPSGVSASALPNTWIALDGGHQLSLSSDWQNQTVEATVSGTYTMVFIWRNDSSGGNQPPAAIDNISISLMNCPRPTALSANNITGRTATLSWTENGTATNWVLQYATNNSFSENLVETNVSGTATKDLTGLTPETTYYARVKSVLGSDESSWSDVKDFTTIATCPKPTLSYVSYSATAYSGTVQWTGSTADAFEVAYRPTSDFDPSDYTLENVTRVQLENVSEYTYTLEGLTPETKYYIYIQANCGGEDGKSLWSNRVIFTTLETCLPPSGLSTSTTSSAITLSWTAGAEGQDAWDIRYKKSTDSDYTYIHLDNHPATSYTITGLSPVTTYDVNVRAWCDENDQSKWGASVNQSYDKSVTTACGAIELPYTCDFEGTMQTVNSCKIPSCWSVIKGYHNSTYSYGIPTVANQSSSTQPIAYPHGGTYCLYFLNSTYSGTSEEYAILPEISEEYKMGNVQIRFWVRSNNTSCQMEVGVMTDPSNANTFVQVEEVGITSTYTEKTISLSSYSGDGRYIALKCPAASMYSQAFYIDDIFVEYIPSCQVPDDLDVDEVGVNDATLSWTPRGTETAWNVQYKKASDSEWSDPIPVEETTYTLTGLRRSTEYEVRVQANCDNDDQSDWTNPINFTTECGIWSIDEANALVENFNGETFPPDYWQKVNFGEMGITNGWLQSFNNPLDNNGAVSSDFKYETWLFLPQMHIDGEALLSFDHLFGSGDNYIPCSIMLSTTPDLNVQGILTEGFIEANFIQIWTADATDLPSTKRNETISLSSYDNQDIYIAFRYEGTYNYSGKIWYIDNVQVAVPVTQTVELAQGTNWWSTNLDITLAQLQAAIETAFGASGTAIIKSQTTSIIYSNGTWIPESLPFDVREMYKIQVSAACELSLTGILVNPSEEELTIYPGNNWIGFPSNASMTVLEAFAGLNPVSGDIVKSQTGSSVYNGSTWIGTVDNLEPGQGYLYYSKATDVKTFTFPTNAK